MKFEHRFEYGHHRYFPIDEEAKESVKLFKRQKVLTINQIESLKEIQGASKLTIINESKEQKNGNK